jgi:hypothetical protein
MFSLLTSLGKLSKNFCGIICPFVNVIPGYLTSLFATAAIPT